MSDQVVIALDPNELTLGEIEQIEDYTGRSLGDIFEAVTGNASVPAKVLTAFVWIAKHRDDPTFTFEQARQVKAASIVAGGETDPTVPPASNGKKPAAATSRA